MKFRIALALSTLIATACGGGHGTVTPPAQSASAAQRNGNALFALTIPNAAQTQAGGRKPAFVSPSTLSGTIQVNGGTVTQLDLGSGAPNCSSYPGGRSCTIGVAAPIGSDTFSLVLYDGPYSGGMHTGTALSAASNFAATVTEGQSNVATGLILGGIPVQADVAVGGTFTGGQAATLPLVVTAYDADSNVIVGPAAYADASGTAVPLTISTSTTSQFTLHDGAQSGGSIAVAAPSDTVTLQLGAPATVLGTYLKVQAAGSVLPNHATNNFVAVSGALQSTLLATSVSFFPDDLYFAPSDSSVLTGVPNGFAFSINATGSGVLGYFNSATEAFASCGYTGYNLGVGAITNGIAIGFNGADNVDTPPTGVEYFPSGSLTGGGCSGGSSYTTNDEFSQSLSYDAVNGHLIEAGHTGLLYDDAFSSPNFSANNPQDNFNPNSPTNLISLGGTTYFILKTATNAIYSFADVNTSTASVKSGATFVSLAAGEDGRIYGVDSTGHGTFVFTSAGSAPATYTPANSLSGSQAAQQFNLAIGPDGNAYSSDGASTIEAGTPGGSASTVTLPAPGGNVGYVRALFDGHNGFVYAYYDDGLHAGYQYVFRISH